MRIAVFSTKPYDQRALEEANRRHGHDLTFFETRLTPDTVALGLGFDAVCPFVNDHAHWTGFSAATSTARRSVSWGRAASARYSAGSPTGSDVVSWRTILFRAKR